MILQLLLAGGTISLGLFFAIIYITNKKLKDNDKEHVNHIILFYFFMYAIVGLTESIVFNNQLWMMLAIGYSIDKLYENYKSVFKEEKKEENYDKEVNV